MIFPVISFYLQNSFSFYYFSILLESVTVVNKQHIIILGTTNKSFQAEEQFHNRKSFLFHSFYSDTNDGYEKQHLKNKSCRKNTTEIDRTY